MLNSCSLHVCGLIIDDQMICLVEVCSINMSLSILKLVDVSIEIDEESSIIIVHIAHLCLQIWVPIRRVIISIRTIIVLSSPRISNTEKSYSIALSNE